MSTTFRLRKRHVWTSSCEETLLLSCCLAAVGVMAFSNSLHKPVCYPPLRQKNPNNMRTTFRKVWKSFCVKVHIKLSWLWRKYVLPHVLHLSNKKTASSLLLHVLSGSKQQNCWQPACCSSALCDHLYDRLAHRMQTCHWPPTSASPFPKSTSQLYEKLVLALPLALCVKQPQSWKHAC